MIELLLNVVVGVLSACNLDKLFVKKQKHEFDLTKELKAKTGIFQKNVDGELIEVTITGYICIHCNKTLWLNADQIIDLPKGMDHCDK